MAQSSTIWFHRGKSMATGLLPRAIKWLLPRRNKILPPLLAGDIGPATQRGRGRRRDATPMINNASAS
jgi:hypothetical protein